VSPALGLRRDSRIQQAWVGPSLLSAFAMMIVEDLSGNYRVRRFVPTLGSAIGAPARYVRLVTSGTSRTEATDTSRGRPGGSAPISSCARLPRRPSLRRRVNFDHVTRHDVHPRPHDPIKIDHAEVICFTPMTAEQSSMPTRPRRASAACKAKPSSTSRFADLANSAISGQLKVASVGGHRAAVKNVIRADDESCPI